MIPIPKTIVGLDFETYFDDQYTLKRDKLTTTNYVRDPRFEIHGVSVRTNQQRKSRWFPRGPKLYRFLEELAGRKDSWGLLCHNTAFDGLILSEHFNIVPTFYFDTLSMARPLYSNEIGASLDEVSKFLGFEGKTSDILERTKGKHWEQFTNKERLEIVDAH